MRVTELLKRLLTFVIVSVRFDSFYANTITAIQTVGFRFKSTMTNRPRVTAPGLPLWSPIQVLTEVDVH